jgi:hypothetical protein
VHNVYGYDLALERRLHERGKLNTLLVPREMQILFLAYVFLWDNQCL